VTTASTTTTARAALAVVLAAVSAAVPRAARSADKKKPPPPPPVVVHASAAGCPHVPFVFKGLAYDPAAKRHASVQWTGSAPVLPAVGRPLAFAISVTSNAASRTVRLAGAVRDYLGVEVGKVAADVAVQADQTATHPVPVQAAPGRTGPFYLAGTWTDLAGKARGEFAAVAGQADARLTVEDFEYARYPAPGGPLESTAAARHGGRRGLLVRIRKPAETDPPRRRRPRPKAQPAPPPLQSVSLGLRLPGRPVKVGLWVRPSGPVQLTAVLRDPGVEVRQTKWPDVWRVGPVPVPAGPWRYVEIPMPGFSRPKAQRREYGELGGIVDYPLTLDRIDVTATHGTDVSLDDLDVWTYGDGAASILLRTICEKPGGLMYRNDTFRMAVANADLTGGPARLAVAVALEDITGRAWPVLERNVTVAPGTAGVLEAPVRGLPIGVYRLVATARAGEKVVAQAGPTEAVLVYEPSGKPLAAEPLQRLLADRNRLLLDLGLRDDVVLVPWHSVDGHPAAEVYQGAWTYDFIEPAIRGPHKAGVRVLGLLGFTAGWADPAATFQRAINLWNGNVYIMPSRKIYWEEYVGRTVEHFAGTVDTWIVWDRPDSDAFGASAAEYAEKMLKVACKAAREANPKAKLISGGIIRQKLEEYLLALSQTGVTKQLDGIGVLPSTTPLAPEDGYLDVTLARAQRIRREEAIGPELWVLNLAWPTGEGAYRVREVDQALYLPRAYVLCRAAGVRRILLRADKTEGESRRDSADLIYPSGSLHCIKPGALTAKAVRRTLDGCTFLREVFLADRRDGLSRAYLFRRADGRVLLCAWRREGTAELPLPIRPEAVHDVFGNNVSLPPGPTPALTLRPAVQYVRFPPGKDADLAKRLQRTPLRCRDAPESAWKQRFTFYLDVGDPADEKAAGYAAPGSRVVGPVDTYYHTEYGRHVVDTGRHFGSEERFAIDVSGYGKADLLLRKRIDYGVQNQLVKVYCNGQFVGRWFAFKRDRRYRWRDIEFIVPNRFFSGKPKAHLRFAARPGTQVTSYFYWAAPLKSRTLYASDLSLLVGSSGYGAGVQHDRNILGGPIRFFKDPKGPHEKGFGTHAAGALAQSLVVLSLNQQYKRLRAVVGVDAATNGEGTVRFRVGDGRKLLWDSKNMTYYDPPKRIDLDVSDAAFLMLWTSDAGDGSKNDIANWANVRLELK